VKITDVIPHIVKPGLPGDTSDQSAWAFIEIQTERDHGLERGHQVRSWRKFHYPERREPREGGLHRRETCLIVTAALSRSHVQHYGADGVRLDRS
jgi:hypothetical protein